MGFPPQGGASSGSILVTGQYTGDGTTSQGITGIGFAPKVVVISRDGTSDSGFELHIKTADMSTEFAYEVGAGANNNGIRDNKIISLDSDGFTVDDNGADENPNSNTATYNYWCLS